MSSIKLTRFVPSQDDLPPALKSAWPVNILAQGTNMDDAIFVYQIGEPDDPIPGDKFQCVASVNQMYEIPKNAAVTLTLEVGIPFYRSNILQFVCRSAQEAERIWTEVKAEVELLVANFNAAATMQATEFAQIDSDGTTTSSPVTMNPPSQIQLTSHPAGTPGIAGGQQVIVTPDATQLGWLPVSALGAFATKPPGAAFFYNISLDSRLKLIWPPQYPLEGNQLHRNGIALPYGVVWTLTQDTIWWLNFNPATIPGYVRTSPGAADGNAPWNTDYVSAGNPGAQQNILTLTLFK